MSKESHKNVFAKRLTDLATEESRLPINRPLNAPAITSILYEQRTTEIDEERKKLRKQLWELCQANRE